MDLMGKIHTIDGECLNVFCKADRLESVFECVLGGGFKVHVRHQRRASVI